MYKCDEMYLYEIIEDYKDAKSQEEKNEIFNSFCSSIWYSSNKRRIYIKNITFKVRQDLIETELGKIFDMWSNVEYKYYKSMTKDENWLAIIRQKINNIYTRYFDKEVVLAKEYMELIKTPKKLYFEWVSGVDLDVLGVTNIIDDAMDKAECVKKRLQMEKMILVWDDYKKIVEEFLQRCFNNCKLIGDYEDKTSISSRFDFLTEDHYYVKYINSCLDGEIKMWQKQYYGVKRGRNKKYKRCKLCRSIIENTNNRSTYCKECGMKIDRNKAKIRMQNIRKKTCSI